MIATVDIEKIKAKVDRAPPSVVEASSMLKSIGVIDAECGLHTISVEYNERNKFRAKRFGPEHKDNCVQSDSFAFQTFSSKPNWRRCR